MPSKVLIVVDYQGCFLPGGGLATNQGPAPVTGDKDGRRMAKELDTLIKSNAYSSVFFTKDMHHPDNVSINDAAPYTADPNFYKGRNIVRARNWVKEEDRRLQKKWPRHCTIPPMNPFYSKLVSIKNIKGMNAANAKAGNVIGSKINEFKPAGNNGPKHYGAELPYALAKYENGAPAGVQSKIVEVYKGFDADTDSYSAVADAMGEFTPFVAKEDGDFKDPNGKLETFMDRLKAENPSDIYLTGIARDVCVYWTAMDILNFWVFPELKKGNTNVPKVHFLYDLTRPVGSVPIEFGPGGVPTKFFVVDISKEDLEKNVGDLYAKMTGKPAAEAADYFSVEMASVAAVAENANNVNNASKWQQGGKRRSRSVITRSGKRTGNNALDLSGGAPKTRRGGKRSNKTRRASSSRKY